MDLKHFGDSYDIIKKSLLQWLAEFGPWKAQPMFTDMPKDTEAVAVSKNFEGFLAVPIVSNCELTPDSDRNHYFDCCGDCRSLFLDPTTGIALPDQPVTRSRLPKYILAKELEILTHGCTGLTLTFDQSLPRGREQPQVQKKLRHFKGRGLHGFSYFSHTSFLLLGKNAALVNKARSQLLAKSGLPDWRILRSDNS